MSAQSVAAAAQAAAERIMVDTCDVTRGTGEGYWDDTLGQWVEGTPTTVWSGPCRLPPPDAVREVDAGEQEVGVTRREVHLPMQGTEGIARGDTVTITSSQDPAMVGVKLTVVRLGGGSLVSARRLLTERVS